ncbi:MAG: hypothetical protein QNK15_10325 [Cycloclasticus sp.]|nr:hypothetical protein [Cycloclasticus sp.]
MKKSIPAFEVALKKSITLRLVMMSVFVLALFSCWLNNLDFIIQCSLSVTVVILFIYTLRSGTLNNMGFSEIRCKPDGCWELIDQTGQSLIATLKGTSAILGPFIFLHFHSKTADLNIVLAADSLSGEAARKIRVALKVYKDQLMAAKV